MSSAADNQYSGEATGNLDLFADAWLARNTTLCIRHQARITLATCEANRTLTEDNFRCAGCGGLHDQQQPKALVVENTPYPVAAPAVIDPLSRAFIVMLQEIISGDYSDSADDLDDEELDDDELWLLPQSAPDEAAALDPFTELLLADLQGHVEEDKPQAKRVEIVEPPERKRRVWVFTGRCPRCSGYMVLAAKEYHDGIVDDEVYRCFTCGWRTSPEYDFNRKNPGAGWR